MSRRGTDTTLIKGRNGAKLDSSLDEFIRIHLPPREVHTARTPEGDLQSLSVPRTVLREQILKDPNFRRALRDLSVELQDFDKRGQPGQLMQARAYVADTKALGVGKATAIPGPLVDSIRSMQEWLDTLGTVMKVGVLGLMLGIPLYAAVQTARYAAKVVEEYAEATAAATETDAGLERVIQARSGIKPAQARVANAEEPKPDQITNPPAGK